MVQSIKAEFLATCPNASANLDYLISTLENSMFLIGDPFNRSYNPAKVKVNSVEAEAYDRAFKTAFLQLKK